MSEQRFYTDKLPEPGSIDLEDPEQARAFALSVKVDGNHIQWVTFSETEKVYLSEMTDEQAIIIANAFYRIIKERFMH